MTKTFSVFPQSERLGLKHSNGSVPAQNSWRLIIPSPSLSSIPPCGSATSDNPDCRSHQSSSPLRSLSNPPYGRALAKVPPIAAEDQSLFRRRKGQPRPQERSTEVVGHGVAAESDSTPCAADETPPHRSGTAPPPRAVLPQAKEVLKESVSFHRTLRPISLDQFLKRNKVVAVDDHVPVGRRRLHRNRPTSCLVRR